MSTTTATLYVALGSWQVCTKVADIAACIPVRKSPNHLLAVCGVGGELHKTCRPLDNTTAHDKFCNNARPACT